MAVNDGTRFNHNPQHTREKTSAYETLFALNRDLEGVLVHFNRLEELGFRREYMRAFRVIVEETRAGANVEAWETLYNRELSDWSHFGHVRRRWEKKYEDPADVLIEAKHMEERLRRQQKKRSKARQPAP